MSKCNIIVNSLQLITIIHFKVLTNEIVDQYLES